MGSPGKPGSGRPERAGSAGSGRRGEKGRKERALGPGMPGRGTRTRARALTFSRLSRSPSSSRCRPCARSSASSACCCKAWILRFTASRELRPAMARGRGGARSGRRAAAGARLGSARLRRKLHQPRPGPRAFACAGAAPASPRPRPGRRRGDEVTRPGRRRQHRWGRA